MVITGFFSNGSFEKRPEFWPSRISIFIQMTISSLIFSRTGCMHTRHTATHRNTLQHTATHCNTHLQSDLLGSGLYTHTTHCNALQCNATHRNTLQHTVTHCNTYLQSELLGNRM
jgi:hypothetical protein